MAPSAVKRKVGEDGAIVPVKEPAARKKFKAADVVCGLCDTNAEDGC